jgi:dihydrofolate synthase/folylpolyglutamate synthase
MRDMDLVHRLGQHHPKTIDLSLDRIKRLLSALGNPEENLPPVIHIAGTNGKGSSLAFMRAIAEAAGLKVHAYTSPHLVHFNERIRIKGKIISDLNMLGLIDEVEALNGNAPITFFEITTAIALLAFSRSPADLTLLETGLGGRLDATNVVTRPAVTALTPISHDHAGFLGNDLGSIAREKAAIMKPRVTCLISKQRPVVLDVIRETANNVEAPLSIEGEDWWVTKNGDRLIVTSPEGELELPLPELVGPHQLQNAGLAIMALAALGKNKITANTIAKGMKSVEWPARMQKIIQGPLTTSLPNDWELWLDGGHNPAAGEALALTLRTFMDRPTHLITGLLNTKEPVGFLKPLQKYTKTLNAVTIPSQDASFPAEKISEIASKIGFNARSAASVSDAITQIVTEETSPSRILICGSLYLAGIILKENK